MNKLPLYKIKINPDSDKGVYAISLVDEPAIESNFFKLSKIPVEFQFSADQDKGFLYGPLLIPDKLIYRKIGDEEFNIVFDKETIEIIANKFNKHKLGDSLNFMHSDKTVSGFMLENWIIEDSTNDKSSKYVKNLPNGTWFSKIKIEDKSFWDKYIKSEELKGFSVEVNVDGLELMLNKNKNFTMEENELKNDLQLGATASDFTDKLEVEVTETVVEEKNTSEEVQENAEKSVEEQVNDFLTPVIEKYDGMFEALQGQIASLEAALVIASEETVSEDVVELKKEIVKLQTIVSSTPATESLNLKDDVKAKRNEDVLNKINFLKNYKNK